jgi:DNA-binding transcriptional LysR family regulator
MDRVDQMAIFVEVAERGSFVQAARRLGRSPAAVTRAIAELETRLGVRLLNRTTRAVTLTEAGQGLLAGAKRVLADFDEIERATAGQGSAPRGELAVTAPIVFGRRHVTPIVTAFLKRYPDVNVRLLLLDRPIDLLDEGIDVAVRIGVLPDSSAVATQVGAVRRVVVAAPSYLARHAVLHAPADLSRHRIISFSGIGGTERWRFAGDAGEIVVRVLPRLTVSTAEAALDAAMSGFGITRVLSYQAAEALAAGTLVRLLAAHETQDLPVHLLYPAGRYPAPKLRAFIDFAAERLRRRLDQIARMIKKR